MTCAPSCAALWLARLPLKLPTPVRPAATITIPVMVNSPENPFARMSNTVRQGRRSDKTCTQISFHAKSGAPFSGPLVSSEWLAKALGEPDLRVYDASLYLPTEGVDAHARYRSAYIPGARFFDIDAI